MSTGTRIAQLRINRQWSQTYLARKVGTNVKSVKDWENDVSLPTANNLKKLSALFITTSDYLLEIDATPVIKLDGLSAEEVMRIRAVVQTLIDTSTSC